MAEEEDGYSEKKTLSSLSAQTWTRPCERSIRGCQDWQVMTTYLHSNRTCYTLHTKIIHQYKFLPYSSLEVANFKRSIFHYVSTYALLEGKPSSQH